MSSVFLAAEFLAALDSQQPGAPVRLQSFVVAGHKADFGLLALDADPLVVDGYEPARDAAAVPISCRLGAAAHRRLPVVSRSKCMEMSF